VHAVLPINMADIGSSVDQVVDSSVALLQAATRLHKFKRVVMVSSSSAAAEIIRPADTTLTGEDYNETSIAAFNEEKGASEKGPMFQFHAYAAAKALADKACLRFVAEHKVIVSTACSPLVKSDSQ
jgi:nucleoside-diphosphate-sugar epimerase